MVELKKQGEKEILTIGGGIVTPVMGFVSDAAGNIPTAELIPALCFAVIFIFARFRSQTATN